MPQEALTFAQGTELLLCALRDVLLIWDHPVGGLVSAEWEPDHMLAVAHALVSHGCPSRLVAQLHRSRPAMLALCWCIARSVRDPSSRQ